MGGHYLAQHHQILSFWQNFLQWPSKQIFEVIFKSKVDRVQEQYFASYTMIFGILQGSILGSLLFITYVKEVKADLKNVSTMFKQANDIKTVLWETENESE